MSTVVPEGTLCRFTRDIVDAPTGDHPEIHYASAGQECSVVSYKERAGYPYTVLLKDGKTVFVDAKEIERV